MKKRFMSILLILCMSLTMLPRTAYALTVDEMDNGWYSIRIGNREHDTYINVDSAGDAVIRAGGRDTLFYLEKKRNAEENRVEITLKLEDGRYLGVDGKIADNMYQVGTNPVYRSSPNGEVIGELPADTILEVIEIKGDWARVKYDNKEYYMWAERLKKVSETRVTAVNSPYLWLLDDSISLRPSENPDMVANVLEYTNGTYVTLRHHPSHAASNAILSFEDWARPINNSEMAELIFDVMVEVHGAWIVQFSSNFAKASPINWTNDKDDTSWFAKDRLYGWRVFTDPKMKWNANPTYGEFTSYLIKLMNFNKGVSDPRMAAFTKDTIKSFGIGGDTSANAKITWEQASTLNAKTIYWLTKELVRIDNLVLPGDVKMQQLSTPPNLVSSGKAPDVTPATPASLTVGKASATSAKCTWKAVLGASGYEIYFATSEKGTYEKAGSTTKELKFTKKSLKAGKKYFFKVRAYKTVSGKKVYGKFSKVKSIQM